LKSLAKGGRDPKGRAIPARRTARIIEEMISLRLFTEKVGARGMGFG